MLWLRTEQGKVRHVAEGGLTGPFRVRSVCGSIQANFSPVDLINRWGNVVHYSLDPESWNLPVCESCAQEMLIKCETIAEQMRRTGAGAT